MAIFARWRRTRRAPRTVAFVPSPNVARVAAEVAPPDYVAAKDADERARTACDVYALCGASMVARVRADSQDEVLLLQALVDVYEFASAAHLRAHLELITKPSDLLADPAVAFGRNAAAMRRAGGRVRSLARQRRDLSRIVDENRKLAAMVRRLTAAANHGR